MAAITYLQGQRGPDRWTYLVTDRRFYGLETVRARVGRSRPLVDFFELGQRVAFALELGRFVGV